MCKHIKDNPTVVVTMTDARGIPIFKIDETGPIDHYKDTMSVIEIRDLPPLSEVDKNGLGELCEQRIRNTFGGLNSDTVRISFDGENRDFTVEEIATAARELRNIPHPTLPNTFYFRIDLPDDRKGG